LAWEDEGGGLAPNALRGSCFPPHQPSPARGGGRKTARARTSVGQLQGRTTARKPVLQSFHMAASPPLRVQRPATVAGSALSRTKWTLPSPATKLTPPACGLQNPHLSGPLTRSASVF